MLDKIALKVNRLRPVPYILMVILGINAIMLAINIILSLLHLSTAIDGPDLEEMGILLSILGGVLAGPILESGVIVLGVKLLKKAGIQNRTALFVIVLVLFSMLHTYSIAYILLTALPAAVIVFSYIYYWSPYLSPFWVMTLVHGGYNLVNLMINYVL